jgi:hypothetical protein
MTVRVGQAPSPRLAVGIITVAITAPLSVVLLFSVITTRQQAVATAVALPVLVALIWIVATRLSARPAGDASGRRWSRQIKSVSRTLLLVCFVLLAPLVLLAIAAHFGQGR